MARQRTVQVGDQANGCGQDSCVEENSAEPIPIPHGGMATTLNVADFKGNISTTNAASGPATLKIEACVEKSKKINFHSFALPILLT